MSSINSLPGDIWEMIYSFHNPIKYYFKKNIREEIWRNTWIRWFKNYNEFKIYKNVNICDDAFKLTMRYLFELWGVKDNENIYTPLIKNDWINHNFFADQMLFTVYPTNDDGCVLVSVKRYDKELFTGWVMDDIEYDIHNDKYNEEVENKVGVFSDKELSLHLIQFTY